MSSPELIEIRGPSAFGGDPRRFRELLWLVAVSDFKRYYANTALGFMWTIVRPLIFFGVIFLVLREIFRFGGNIENFGQILIVGLVLFQYFSDVTGRALRSVPAKESIVRKMQFPRIVIPLAVGLTSTFTLALNLVAVLPLLMISGITPTVEWLLVIPVLALLVAYSTGLGMILSVLVLQFEDVAQAWGLIARILFYATPVLYPLDALDPPFSDVISVNPLAMLIEQARVYLIGSSQIGPLDAAGPLFGVAIPLTLTLLTPLVGMWLFNLRAPRVAEAL